MLYINPLIKNLISKKRSKKKPYGISALAIKPEIVISEPSEDKKLNWIVGDVTKFNFDDELVDIDESNKRLIIIFLVTGFILLIISTVLTIQYYFIRLET